MIDQNLLTRPRIVVKRFVTLHAKFQAIGLGCWVYKDFLVPSSTPESCFEKSGFCQEETKMRVKRLGVKEYADNNEA